MSAEALRARVEAGEARVVVVGLGHTGLPLCATLVEGGLRVVGFDADTGRVGRLRGGEDLPGVLGAGAVARMLETGRFDVSTDGAVVARADVVCVCVPTPLDEHQRPDLRPVDETMRTIARHRGGPLLVVLESTTWPGTTREVVAPRLAEGPRGAADLFVAYSPERIDPGRAGATPRTIPRLVGGLDAASGELAARFYEGFTDTVVRVRSAEVAEAAKLLENVYRAVNIALVNEMKLTLDAMGLDVWEVVEAAATKPFGYEPFVPGPGLGGHCIPVDPFFLAHRARQVGRPIDLVELAGRINRAMPERVVERLERGLAERGGRAGAVPAPSDAAPDAGGPSSAGAPDAGAAQGASDAAPDAGAAQGAVASPLAGARVLVIGLAYKAGIDDVRESPSLAILELCAARGAVADYHDPHVPEHRASGRRSVPLDAAAAGSYDAVVISTAHPEVDYALLARHARLIVDTRNAMAPHPEARVVKA